MTNPGLPMGLLDALAGVLGKGGLLLDKDVSSRPEGWASPRGSKAAAIARPRNTSDVSRVLGLCHQARIPVVPYGGGTGLVGGAVAERGEILLSLERMRSIEVIDPVNRTAIVEAGVTLQQLQEEADECGLAFPLDLGARGSATIGGNIATNAGGNRVIRFGMMREMVLGIEAVLADGTILSSMNRMLKNNSGYDLKQLFIGSEGTLGIVTRAVLRLREKWMSEIAALVTVEHFADIPHVLKTLDRRFGGSLSAFEVMWREFYDIVTAPYASNAPPLPRGAPFYILIETLGAYGGSDRQRFETVLSELIEEGRISDAVIAASDKQAAALWAIRDDVEQILKVGPIFMFDVSLPISEMEDYVRQVREALDAKWPDNLCVVWGHLGDCNLHLWISVRSASARARGQVERMVYRPLRDIGGSISAEHGIGSEKLPYMSLTRNKEEIELMRRLKKALDPYNILSPGRVIG